VPRSLDDDGETVSLCMFFVGGCVITAHNACVCVLKSLLLMFTLSVCVSVLSFLFMCEVTKEGDS